MGGNEKENLVELTIEDHAEAHRLLFEEHGCWQDKIAWQTLSGQISGIEAAQLARRLANTGDNNPMRRCPGAKEKMAAALRGRTYGPCSEERKRKIGERAKGNTRGAFGKGVSRGKGVPKSEETRVKMSLSAKGKIYITNGITNRKIYPENEIPEKWWKGKITLTDNQLKATL